MKNYIAATFGSLESADEAIESLEENGVAVSQISVLTKEDVANRHVKLKDDDKARGISKSAATGGVIGGVLGLLAGIGTVTIPGLGPLLLAGPVAAALGIGVAASATATGAVTGVLAGGLVGTLKEFGLDEAKAKAIESKIKSGYVLLFVDVLDSEEKKLIHDILKRTSAEDITSLTYKQ